MSTEHQSVRAEMARLQGEGDDDHKYPRRNKRLTDPFGIDTIDECRKTLDQNSHLPNRIKPNCITNASKAVIPSRHSPALDNSLTGSYPRSSAIQAHASSAHPPPTKLVWHLSRPSTRSSLITTSTTAFGLQPARGGSKKLILNKPILKTQPRQDPLKQASPDLSTSAAIITPSSDQYTTTKSLRPTSAIFVPKSISEHPSPLPNSVHLTSLGRNSSPDIVVQEDPSECTAQPNPSASLGDSAAGPARFNVGQAASTFQTMTISPAPESTTTPATALSSPSKRHEVVIGGVSFVRDSQGKKLVRKAANTAVASQSDSLTPIKASIGGTTYVRTKSGNLIALGALKKFQAQKLHQAKRARLLTLVDSMKHRYDAPASFNSTWKNPVMTRMARPQATKFTRPRVMKKNEQCRFFAKTGVCRKGLTCVYQHDPAQVAICPRFLRHKCPNSANSCPLSHKPDPHNMEHCSHFPRCTKADCPYPHVKPTSSQVCKDFSELGWCSKGLTCAERHVRECSEFSSKGTCSNPACRLPHVINRNNNEPGSDDDKTSGNSDDEGAGLFFTDLKGKRKASDEQMLNPGPSPHIPPVFRGISHNAANKRNKSDGVADNEDFVMFVDSDVEDHSEQDAEESMDAGEDDDDSSVESEELNSVLMEEFPLEEPIESFSRRSSGHLAQPIPARSRNRANLEPGEEIEDGEIFDDDDDGHHPVEDGDKTSEMETSDDEDEIVARQLLGNK